MEGWLWINCNERACKSVTRKSHCLFQKGEGTLISCVLPKQVQLANEQIRLCIVDDHSFIRESLHTILGGLEDLQVVGMAEDGERALELCERLKPDVVLMDLEMPNLDGIHATKMIKKNGRTFVYSFCQPSRIQKGPKKSYEMVRMDMY